MPDIEKVIKGLELCKYDPDPGQENKGIHSCVKCPYYNDGIMPDCQVMFTDAIELLKEQLKTKTVVCQRCGDEIEVKWSVLAKPDAEAIAKRDAFLSDDNGKKLQKAIDQIHCCIPFKKEKADENRTDRC